MMSKHITIIGTGYVGLVTGACFAQLGHNVVCLDNNEEKIVALAQGRVTFYEPNLDEMVTKHCEQGTLHFTTNYSVAIKHGEVIFIAVDTPSQKDGSADMSRVFGAVDGITDYMENDKVIVVKSTAPIGTCRHINNYIAKRLDGRHCTLNFSVVSNPEFLREGSAVSDFMRPDRIVIGTFESKSRQILRELYQPLIDDGVLCVETDPQSAELTKYASNALLATRLAFINEISNLCECVEANMDDVSFGMGLDKRIGPSFLKPGPGFGGSCFPKDIKALVHMGVEYNCQMSMISTAIESNRLQKIRAVEKITRLTGGLFGKTIAILGTAFKANTDDVRESPAIDIILHLVLEKANVRVFDPQATNNTIEKLSSTVYYAENEYDAAKKADVIVILTEWKQFAALEYNKLADIVKHRIIIDFRSILCKEDVVNAGFTYYRIGISENH